MIIGNGALSRAFGFYHNNKEILIFASGVSNSAETNVKNFRREEALLQETIGKHRNKIIVYFGTCSVYDKSVSHTPYVLHKLKMENIIKKTCDYYYIFRLPQVIAFSYNQTFVMHIFSTIATNKSIDIYKYSTRNLIKADDVFFVAKYLIENKIYLNEVTNIATPYNWQVIDIVKVIQKITGISPSYTLVNAGHKVDIDISKITKLNISFNFLSPNYLDKALHSYYQEFGGMFDQR